MLLYNYKIIMRWLMNLLFDEDSQKLIVMAKKEMAELKHPYVGSEHLLLAILKNDNLEVTKLLNKYGINYLDYRKEIVKVIGIGTKSNNWFLFTPLLRRIINNATYYSADSNRVVTPNSLLISILQEGEGVANRILIGMDIDLESIYNKLINGSNYYKNDQSFLLDELAVNMNKDSENGKYDPVIGRDVQVERLIQILLRKNKNNPLLIGEAGVGKTAIVEELARRIVIGDVPSKLRNKMIYNISMSVLVAGTKYRGEFEERINKIIKEVLKNKNIILFIDEIHTLVGAGGAEGAIDASNIIKPYLARGDFQIIGSTTNIEYNNSIAKDKALDRRFQKVYISEPNEDETIEIISNLKNIYEEYHDITIPIDLVAPLVRLSNNYIHYGRQPDKAIDLLDESAAYCSSFTNNYNKKLDSLDKKIKNKEQEKNEAILNRLFADALLLRKEELSLRNKYNKLKFNEKSNINKMRLRIDDIYRVIFEKTGIPIGERLYILLNKARKNMKIVCFKKNRIVDETIDHIKNNYLLNDRPLSFLLVGKSGVGKTFFVEELAKNICEPDSFIKFDLSEYSNNNSINKIFDPSLGFTNQNNRYTFLDKIKLHPFSIILFKNVNMCADNIYEMLVNLLINGYLTNGRGEKIFFSNSIIFFTTTINCNKLGFNNGNTNNDLSLKVSKVLKFRDVTKKDVVKLLSNSMNIANINIEALLVDIDYENYGYKKVYEYLKKNIHNNETKS